MIISHDCCISATEENVPGVSNYLLALAQHVPGQHVPGRSPNDRKQKQKNLLFALKVASWFTQRRQQIPAAADSSSSSCTRVAGICCCCSNNNNNSNSSSCYSSCSCCCLGLGHPHASVLGDHAGPPPHLSACLFPASFSPLNH